MLCYSQQDPHRVGPNSGSLATPRPIGTRGVVGVVPQPRVGHLVGVEADRGGNGLVATWNGVTALPMFVRVGSIGATIDIGRSVAARTFASTRDTNRAYRGTAVAGSDVISDPIVAADRTGA